MVGTLTCCMRIVRLIRKVNHWHSAISTHLVGAGFFWLLLVSPSPPLFSMEDKIGA